MLERRANDHLACWEDSKEIISEHECIFKSQFRHIHYISKQVTGLDNKLLKKTRQQEEMKRKLKRKKDYNRSMERELKASETD